MKTKKELKDEYKQHKSQMGVFQIRNKETGRIFVDFHTDVNAKINRHKAQLKFGNHPNKELQKDWKLSGEEQFSFELLSEMKYSKDEEQDYKAELKVLSELVISEMNEEIEFY